MDKSLWILVSFAVGFIVMAVLIGLVAGLPERSIGFFETITDSVFGEWL